MVSYPVLKARESLPKFFKGITLEVYNDSKAVYRWIFRIAILIAVVGLIDRFFLYQIDLSKIHTVLLDGVSGVYLLLPPFVLAIIAMFPAFSDKTKAVLTTKDENGKAFGAVFLNEFVFLTFWSLVVLAHSVLSNIVYTWVAVTSPNWVFALVAVNLGVSAGCILVVAYEIFHSIKIMYMMVLKEYY